MNFQRRTVCTVYSLALLFSTCALSAQKDVSNTPVTIWSEGSRLAGNLWKPNSVENDRVPAVLLVHGWGGTKDHLNQAYAPRFAQMGYVVLTFDYRGWGESEGRYYRADGAETEESSFTEIREIVDPFNQLEDIRNAVAFLLGDENVDTDRMAIWGTSLGGGLALQIAGEFQQFKVLITQVGAVNSKGNMERDPNFVARTLAAQSERVRGNSPPIPEGGIPGLRGAPDMFKFMRYDPLSYSGSVTAATLIIDAANEELFDTSMNGKLLHNKIKDRIEAKYVSVPGTHYGIYAGPGYRQAMNEITAWLEQHL